MPKFQCDSCDRQIKHGQRYCLHLDLFASPEVELDENDLAASPSKRLKQLYEQLKRQDPKKLEEEVYIGFDLNLCKSCRDKFVQRIKLREFI